MNEYYESKDGGSAKFWSVRVKGARMTTSWGRIGSAGQTKEKEFDSRAKALAEAEKKRDQKVGKGYRLASKKAGTAKKGAAKKTANTGANTSPKARKPNESTAKSAKSGAKKPKKKSNRDALPPVALEAFQHDASTPLKLKKPDLDFFKGLIRGNNVNSPELSARHLRLVRLLELAPNVPYGNSTKDTLVACIDISQLPKAWSKPTGVWGPAILLHMSHMVQKLVEGMGVRILTYTLGGGFTGMVIGSGKRKLRALLELHEEYIADGALYLGEPDPAWQPWVDLTAKNLKKERARSQTK